MAPLDPRYTKVGFNLISVQVGLMHLSLRSFCNERRKHDPIPETWLIKGCPFDCALGGGGIKNAQFRAYIQYHSFN